MKVILISPAQQQDSEIGILLNIFEHGLPTYHVRKKTFSTRQLKEYLEEIPEKYHNRIVIHSHHELALKFNLKGIYISRSHKKRKMKLWFWKKWLKLRRKQLEISTMLRNIEGVLEYIPRYDYIFLSPVFDSLSGNFQSAFSDYNLIPTLKNSKYKVIARGGVSVNNIERAHKLGFAGIAFYTSIWKADSPLKEFMKVKEKFEELSLTME
jgi:thiamine-phosphate pyrophosphorylase